jgi:hypothetical protein
MNQPYEKFHQTTLLSSVLLSSMSLSVVPPARKYRLGSELVRHLSRASSPVPAQPGPNLHGLAATGIRPEATIAAQGCWSRPPYEGAEGSACAMMEDAFQRLLEGLHGRVAQSQMDHDHDHDHGRYHDHDDHGHGHGHDHDDHHQN